MMADELFALRVELLPVLQTSIDDRCARLGQQLENMDHHNNAELLSEIQRDLHTIKGETRLLGYPTISSVAHLAEEALIPYRESESLAPSFVAWLLRCLDAVAKAIEHTDAKNEGTIDVDTLRSHLPKFEHDKKLLNGAPQKKSPQSDEQPEGKKFKPSVSRDGRLQQLPHRSFQHEIRLRGIASEFEQWLSALKSDLLPRQNRVAAQHILKNIKNAAQGSARISQDIAGLNVVPISDAFLALPRLVRESSESLGKRVNFVVSHEDFELNNTLATSLREPLLHLIQNAIDHGIESEEQRIHAGKNPIGQLQLHAVSRGLFAEISLRDDGQGIDLAGVKRRAIAHHLLSPESAQTLEDADILPFIFHSGLSTKTNATQWSGRGVGLDVVAQHLEKLGGNIRAESQATQGTLFTLTIPLQQLQSNLVFVKVESLNFALQATQVEAITLGKSVSLSTMGSRFVANYNGLRLPYMDSHALMGATEIKPRRLLLKIEGQSGPWFLGVDEIQKQYPSLVYPLPKILEGHALLAGIVYDESGQLVPLVSGQALLRDARLHRGPSRSEEKSSPSDVAPPQNTIKTALVVDDSELTRDYICALLNRMEIQTKTAVNGSLALDTLRQWTPDIVFSDLQMPVMDGFTLITRIRATPEFKHLPVVVLSSLTAASDVQNAIARGATTYITKADLTPERLDHVLRSLSPSPQNP